MKLLHWEFPLLFYLEFLLKKMLKGQVLIMITESFKKPSALLKNDIQNLSLLRIHAYVSIPITVIVALLKMDQVLNDPSLDLLARTAIAQAKAGADIIAPSNMMDGFVAAIRYGLDEAGFTDIPIMSYAVKYASSILWSIPRCSRSAHHNLVIVRPIKWIHANRNEAIREAASDVEEGADFLIVKPALSYLDIVRDVKNNFDLPVVAYNVSGEYAMVKAAAQNGWIDEKKIVLETLTSMKRAGADLIMTYHAKDVARWLEEK